MTEAGVALLYAVHQGEIYMVIKLWVWPSLLPDSPTHCRSLCCQQCQASSLEYSARSRLRPGRHQAWLSMMNTIISLAGFFLHMTGVPAEVALVVIDALPTRSTELRVPSCLSRCPAGLCSIILCSCSYISTMTWSLLLLLLHRSFSDSSSNMIVQAWDIERYQKICITLDFQLQDYSGTKLRVRVPSNLFVFFVLWACAHLIGPSLLQVYY